MSNNSNNSELRLQYAQQQPHYINNSTIAQPILHNPPIVYGNSTNIQHYYQPHQQHYIMSRQNYSPPPLQLYTPSPPQMMGYYPQNDMLVRGSPSSISPAGGNSPRTPPAINSRNNDKLPQPKHTIPSSSPPTNLFMFSPLDTTTPSPSISIDNTEERVKETIARVNAVPIEFYQTKFHEYSQTSQLSSKKRKRTITDNNSSCNSFKKFNLSELNEEEEYDDSDERQNNSSELHRKVHIQSEQKRRAQIKDGFEVLKSHLPGCTNKKMSKAALLTRTVQQLQHMKKMQSELLAEVERLAEENANLKSRLSQQPVAAMIPTSDQQQ